MFLVSKYFRGPTVESFHIGFAVAVDESGDLLFAAGEPDYPVFIRSTAKPFQTAAILESGAAEKFNLNDEEIAVMCSSHSGESYHVDAVNSILKKIDANLDQLACGIHPPLDRQSYEQLVLQGRRPTALHHICSGEHAGMLAMAKALGIDPTNYNQPNHPLQLRIFDKIKHYAGRDKIPMAIDNCNAPTYFLPLKNLALMYKQLVSNEDDNLRRIYHAMSLHPRMVSGRNRFDTDFITHMSGRGVAKIGSEGVRGLGIRTEEGKSVGIAIKVQSGNPEACDSMTIAMLKHLHLIDDEMVKKLEAYYSPSIKSSTDIEVGKIQTEIVTD